MTSTSRSQLQSLLRAARARERPVIGTWLQLPGYVLAKLVAPMGADAIIVDCEHGNISDDAMYLQVGAILSAGVSPIVRVPAGETIPIKRALDAGAHAIMVPMVSNKEQAEAVVKFAKYPSTEYPQAVRGVGSIIAHAAFEQNRQDYVASANADTVVMVQVETKEALNNVEEVASVAGIDLLFIGTGDLSQSMGYSPFEATKTPAVQEACIKILEACHAAGKYAGIIAFSPEQAAQFYQQGFDFVTCGSDIMALSAGIEGGINKLKQNLVEPRQNGKL